MPTTGEAILLRSNINTYLGLALIASFTLGCGLILWHAAFGSNPIVNLLLSSSAAQYNNY